MALNRHTPRTTVAVFGTLPDSSMVRHAMPLDSHTPRTTVAVFDTLPDSGMVRLAGLIQTPNAPGNPLPFSAATLWRYVKNGTFPAPVKLGAKTTAWRVADVRAWLAAQ